MNNIDWSFLNDVKNRFLPLPRSAVEGLEHEPKKSDFEFLEDLGEGTFGSVYLASHKKTKAKYAIKSIDKLDPENLAEKKNFNREVGIMYKLNHPNIVKLFGHFEDEKYCYFIMQYIPKRSVFELIPQKGQKPNIKLIASVMKDLLKAVYYLHHMKPTIIHRDIKPENILLNENSKAFLTDFGWSNYMISERRHTCCGTPLYLPPEMVGDFGHDETADIWCIGVLLFELITGKTPFEGNDIDTVKYNISKLNISWPPYMDPDAKDLTSKILRLNGKDRLPIEDILKHKFFSQFFPNAINELTKPENQKNKIFVVSVDDPKNWCNNETQNLKSSLKLKKININSNKNRLINNNSINIKKNENNKNRIKNNNNNNNKSTNNIVMSNRRIERTKTSKGPFLNINLSNDDQIKPNNITYNNIVNNKDYYKNNYYNTNNKSNDKVSGIKKIYLKNYNYPNKRNKTLNNSTSPNKKYRRRVINNYNNNQNYTNINKNNNRSIKNKMNIQTYSNGTRNCIRRNNVNTITYSNVNKVHNTNKINNNMNINCYLNINKNNNYQSIYTGDHYSYRNSYNNNHTTYYSSYNNNKY